MSLYDTYTIENVREILKNYFLTGKKPTEKQFHFLIDSILDKNVFNNDLNLECKNILNLSSISSSCSGLPIFINNDIVTNNVSAVDLVIRNLTAQNVDILNYEISGFEITGDLGLQTNLFVSGSQIIYNDLNIHKNLFVDLISSHSGDIFIVGKSFSGQGEDGSDISITAGNSLSSFGGNLILNAGIGLSGNGIITLSGETVIYDKLTVNNVLSAPNLKVSNLTADYIKVDQIDITNLEIQGYTVSGDLVVSDSVIVDDCVITDCLSSFSGDINITGKSFDGLNEDGGNIFINAGDSLSAFGGDINFNVGNGLSGNGSITLNGDTLINSNLEVSNNIKTATLNVENRVDLSIAGTGDGMYLTDLDSDGGLTMLTITDRSGVGNTILDINRVPQVPDPRPTIDEYTFTQDYVDFHGNFLLNSPISSTLSAIRIDGATFPDMDGGDIIITGGHSLSSYGGNLLFTAGRGISGDGTITLSGDTTIYDDLTVSNSITSPNISADYIKVNQIDITNLEIAGYTVDGDLIVNDCVITDCISAQSGDINITGKSFDGLNEDGSNIFINAGNSLSAFGGDIKLTVGDGLSGAGTITLSGDTTIYNDLTVTDSVTVVGGLTSTSVSASVYYGLPPTTYQNSTPIPADFPNSDTPSVNAGSTIFSTPKSIQEMFDIILYPTLFPTLTNPSNTFVLSQEGLREIGTVITLNFTSTFNRGSVSPAYCGTSQFRSGSAEQYNYTGTNLPATVISNLNSDSQTVNNYEVLLGNQSWTSNVSYASGDQPKDSKCGDFSSPLIAGTTSTITKTINGVYPVYGTTSNITTLTKRPLQTMNQNITISLVNESGSDKQKVLIPQNWSNIVKLYQFNTFSQVYDEINLNTFTKTATSYFVNSNASSVNYWLYEHNGSGIGARTLRFNVS